MGLVLSTQKLKSNGPAKEFESRERLAIQHGQSKALQRFAANMKHRAIWTWAIDNVSPWEWPGRSSCKAPNAEPTIIMERPWDAVGWHMAPGSAVPHGDGRHFFTHRNPQHRDYARVLAILDFKPAWTFLNLFFGQPSLAACQHVATTCFWGVMGRVMVSRSLHKSCPGLSASIATIHLGHGFCHWHQHEFNIHTAQAPRLKPKMTIHGHTLTSHYIYINTRQFFTHCVGRPLKKYAAFHAWMKSG